MRIEDEVPTGIGPMLESGWSKSRAWPRGRRGTTLLWMAKWRRTWFFLAYLVFAIWFIAGTSATLTQIHLHQAYSAAEVCEAASDSCGYEDRAVDAVTISDSSISTNGSGKNRTTTLEIQFQDQSGDVTTCDGCGPYGFAFFTADQPLPNGSPPAVSASMTAEFWRGEVMWMAFTPQGTRYYADESVTERTKDKTLPLGVLCITYGLFACARWWVQTRRGKVSDRAFRRPVLFLAALATSVTGASLLAAWQTAGIFLIGGALLLATVLALPPLAPTSWPRPGRTPGCKARHSTPSETSQSPR